MPTSEKGRGQTQDAHFSAPETNRALATQHQVPPGEVRGHDAHATEPVRNEATSRHPVNVPDVGQGQGQVKHSSGQGQGQVKHSSGPRTKEIMQAKKTGLLASYKKK